MLFNMFSDEINGNVLGKAWPVDGVDEQGKTDSLIKYL
jgi:hypothetical protein